MSSETVLFDTGTNEFNRARARLLRVLELVRLTQVQMNNQYQRYISSVLELVRLMQVQNSTVANAQDLSMCKQMCFRNILFNTLT